MKKILLSLLSLLLFSGCVESQSKLDEHLVGTKWQTEIILGTDTYDVLEFINTTQVERYTTRNDNIVYMNGVHEYELNYPYLVIHTMNPELNANVDYNFIFTNSRTLVLDCDSSVFYTTYIRQ